MLFLPLSFLFHRAHLPISISLTHKFRSHEMASNQHSCNHADDDYIDMEVSSSSSSSDFLCYSISSPSQSREFEFQMSSVCHDKEATTSPADELFYKGKLLPLHLPPRLQMVQKLLQNSATGTTPLDNKTEEPIEENYNIPFTTSSTTPSIKANTPLESCNISPSESCRVSCELNPDEYFFEWSTEMNGFIGDLPKKSWTKRLKRSSLGQKLKASSAYLKFLFSKSACKDESCAKAARNADAENVPRSKDCLSKYMKVGKKNPFGKTDNERYSKLSNTLMKSIEKEMAAEECFNTQRRSFSGAIQWHSATKSSSSSSSTSSSGSSSSSSSFSFSSNGLHDAQLLKRSSSANSDIETSIEGAIAYCKKSQQLFCARKPTDEAEVCSLSASAIGSRELERPNICSV